MRQIEGSTPVTASRAGGPMTRAHRWVQVTLAVSLALVASCSKEGPTGPSTSTGTVTGVVTAADGVTRIGAATVSLASTGMPSTTADAQGAYALNGLPAGPQTLRARKGNFEASLSVTVTPGASVVAPSARLTATGRLAYVPGSYDSIERIVRDQLGNTVDQLSTGQLGNAATLAQYRMLFLNCGLSTAPAATMSTLLAWVRGGGTLYASDFAMSYVQGMVPNDVPELESGPSQSVSANVTDAGLQAFLGRSSAQIVYDLPGWIGLRQVSARARVLLRGSYQADGGPVSNRPLAVVFTEGTGKIVYTSFHNEAGVTADQVAILRYFVYID